MLRLLASGGKRQTARKQNKFCMCSRQVCARASPRWHARHRGTAAAAPVGPRPAPQSQARLTFGHCGRLHVGAWNCLETPDCIGCSQHLQTGLESASLSRQIDRGSTVAWPRHHLVQDGQQVHWHDYGHALHCELADVLFQEFALSIAPAVSRLSRGQLPVSIQGGPEAADQHTGLREFTHSATWLRRTSNQPNRSLR